MFFRMALDALGTTEAVMVGDDIRADVGGAQDAGLQGVLVRTGKFRPEDLDGPVTPAAVLGSIADLPRWPGLRAPAT
jgi:ribonucleotide monophosphatase NagD (HAD superfamily)